MMGCDVCTCEMSTFLPARGKEVFLCLVQAVGHEAHDGFYREQDSGHE